MGLFKCVFVVNRGTDRADQSQQAIIRYEPTSSLHAPPVIPTHADPLSKF